MAGSIAPREQSAEAAAAAALARIAETDGNIEAWAHVRGEALLDEARHLDAQARRGPLHGLAVGVKDIIDTFDMPTEYGSPIYAGHRPTADAACVAALRAAGALIVGKTVTTEFAATTPGPTRNPFNLAHTPGGSSSGSAAAVGAGHVPVALATQTMGSLIRPAAFCGAVGFKPSFATVNRNGVKPQAESLDTVGAVAATLDDAARVISVLVDGSGSTFDGEVARPPRIAVYRGPDWSKAEAPAVAALDRAVSLFSQAGARIREVEPADVLREAFDAQPTCVFFEMSRALADEMNRFPDRISAELMGFLRAGARTSFAAYLEAERTGRAARRWIEDEFRSADVWLTLSAPGEAPAGMPTGDVTFNRLWTFLHLPAVTLPAGRGPQGLPLGVQLIAPYRGDAGLVAHARWAERLLRTVQ